LKIRKPRQKKYYSKEIFSAELAGILEKYKISQDEFNKEINVQQAVTRWKSGETTPSADSLLAIKKAFGVSIDQLLTGQTESQGLQEFIPVSYDARPLAPIEADLLNEAMIMVEEILKKEKRQLQPEQKAKLLTRIYNDCAEDRIKPDSIMVKRYLWLLE
jgi:transcriptional regulator with XRE-family HTH domain